MVFDVGLQCATLVSVTVLAHSWSCKPYLRMYLVLGCESRECQLSP